MHALLDELERITGHRFADLALALQSLTHTSYANEHPDAFDNERLEFIGDAAVGLCATMLLAEAFPDAAEGELTRLRQQMISRGALGRLGASMGIAPLIRLGRSEAVKATPEASVVGCAVEAIFGALLQEAGFAACLVMARRWMTKPIAALQRAQNAQSAFKDGKSRLQEFTQSRWKVNPTYEVMDMEGPAHAPTWRVEVSVNGECLAEGSASKKDEAMKRAAHLALATLRRRETAS